MNAIYSNGLNIADQIINEVVKQILLNIEEGKKCSINILQAVQMIDYTWCIKPGTIFNYFKTCGSNKENPSTAETAEYLNNDDDLLDNNFTEITFNEYVSVDIEVAVCGILTDSNVIDSMRNHNYSDEEGEIEEENLITPQKAKGMIIKLKTFIENLNDANENIFSALITINAFVDKHIIFQKKK